MSYIAKVLPHNKPDTKLPGTMTLIVSILAVLIVAAACGEQLTPTEPGQTATVVQGKTSPTEPGPTGAVTQEWTLEDIQIDGSTVTVQLSVNAGIDVEVILDGQQAEEVRSDIPNLDYVFTNVTQGTHTVVIQDVVGFVETTEVVVTEFTSVTISSGDTVPIHDDLPAWLASLIVEMTNAPVSSPPSSITSYLYEGQTVYFVPQRCCDIFSDLYDLDGNIIGHPDGGITGQGDGSVPGFFEERTAELVIWEDERTNHPGIAQVLAPIESVEVLILESFPAQYNVSVVLGLPNACVTFDGYFLDRAPGLVQIQVLNQQPADLEVSCAQVYSSMSLVVRLGSDFEAGETYTVEVNDVIETFVAQ